MPLEAQQWGASVLMLFLPSILFPLSLLVLGIVLFRTKVIPPWVALLLALGAVVFLFGRILRDELVTHISDVGWLIPMAWIGLQYLRQPADDTSTAPLSAAAAAPSVAALAPAQAAPLVLC